jgi:hypothetical protein
MKVHMRSNRRGQANLLALAVSLLVLTTTFGFCLVLIDGAYRSADRDPGERRIAVALAERLVSEESRLTSRSNVINGTRVKTLTLARFGRVYPVANETDVRIRLSGKTIVKRGDTTGGTTIRRVVLIERRQSITLPFRGDTLTLPRRSPRATIVITPDTDTGTAITTVRANDRVVIYDPDGLEGEFEIDLSRYETTTLQIEPAGAATVTVTYYPAQATKAELVVTIDA